MLQKIKQKYQPTEAVGASTKKDPKKAAGPEIKVGSMITLRGWDKGWRSCFGEVYELLHIERNNGILCGRCCDLRTGLIFTVNVTPRITVALASADEVAAAKASQAEYEAKMQAEKKRIWGAKRPADPKRKEVEARQAEQKRKEAEEADQARLPSAFPTAADPRAAFEKAYKLLKKHCDNKEEKVVSFTCRCPWVLVKKKVEEACFDRPPMWGECTTDVTVYDVYDLSSAHTAHLKDRYTRPVWTTREYYAKFSDDAEPAIVYGGNRIQCRDLRHTVT